MSVDWLTTVPLSIQKTLEKSRLSILSTLAGNTNWLHESVLSSAFARQRAEDFTSRLRYQAPSMSDSAIVRSPTYCINKNLPAARS